MISFLLIALCTQRWKPRLPARVVAFVALVSAKVTGQQKLTRDALSMRYRKALAEIVKARLRNESSHELGEPVFVSHYIKNGVFRHWALHAHGHKFELRRKVPPSLFEWQGSTSLLAAGKYYESAVGNSGFSMEIYKRSVLARYSPEVGQYYYSMVGWTTLSKDEIQQRSVELFQRFGNYKLVSNNCQDFLRALANEIVTAKAPDWAWLQSGSMRSYTYGCKYPLPAEVIHVAVIIERLKQLQPHLGPAEQQELDQVIADFEQYVEKEVEKVSGRSSHILVTLGDAGYADGGNESHGGCAAAALASREERRDMVARDGA
ncbi:hypothetical protein NQ176_g3316 [Zarea fungicola]|uniref:Uncharacterized protein n=1 Tax=Zarea fungicola TaxID=93591 RepID=A0ACC1NKA8_9HYPO|nr:hypothetical protein NQ176_g3316 [Lecanicillium fungicola]